MSSFSSFNLGLLRDVFVALAPRRAKFIAEAWDCSWPDGALLSPSFQAVVSMFSRISSGQVPLGRTSQMGGMATRTCRIDGFLD